MESVAIIAECRSYYTWLPKSCFDAFHDISRWIVLRRSVLPPSLDELIVIRRYSRFGEWHLKKIGMPAPFECVVVRAHRCGMGNSECDNLAHSFGRDDGTSQRCES